MKTTAEEMARWVKRHEECLEYGHALLSTTDDYEYAFCGRCGEQFKLSKPSDEERERIRKMVRIR